MLTPEGLMLMCNECGYVHVTIAEAFDGFQWWDYCPVGCGRTPHANTWPGVEAMEVFDEEYEFDMCPVPEV